MSEVVLVIHLFLALAIIMLVLLQRSEGGGLGIGGGSGGMGGLASPRGTANMLTRMTALCGAAFFCTSLILGVLAGQQTTSRSESIFDAVEEQPAGEQNIIQDALNELEAIPDAPMDAPADIENIEPPPAPIAE